MIRPFEEYAGFGTRAIAAIVDFAWLAAVVFACSYFLLGSEILTQLLSGDEAALQQAGIQAFLLNDVLPFLLTLFFWIRYGATPGKIVADCEIVHATTGKPITLGQAVLRYLAYLISALPLGLGFLWILWDKRKQGWHDKIANTVVIMHDEMNVPLNKLVQS
ncbi:RDD family protein [Candidatus Albibeggiatoa sp. nov. NOAA]|uniref:RDD family protein n=1 Tax=Candidatus Albibeggiatoa sp. nov. NOAA TaxID=3162724 RepID=UPI0032F38F94|nr:RDD family protein [Thiotrichaceae bacterium]